MTPSIQSLRQLLENNPIFHSLNSTDIDYVARQAIKKQYTRGQFITYYGDVWPYLFLVEDGLINVIKESSEGRRFLLVSLMPGEIFWGLAFFHKGAHMPGQLIAKEDTTLYLWSRDSLLPFIKEHGEIAWEISREMIKRMQIASDIVEELVFLPLVGRLARFLLEYFGETADQYVSRGLTLDEMAARIGTTREMVCRMLYKFAEEGAIEISRTEFKITDRKKLEEPAGKVKG